MGEGVRGRGLCFLSSGGSLVCDVVGGVGVRWVGLFVGVFYCDGGAICLYSVRQAFFRAHLLFFAVQFS